MSNWNEWETLITTEYSNYLTHAPDGQEIVPYEKFKPIITENYAEIMTALLVRTYNRTLIGLVHYTSELNSYYGNGRDTTLLSTIKGSNEMNTISLDKITMKYQELGRANPQYDMGNLYGMVLGAMYGYLTTQSIVVDEDSGTSYPLILELIDIHTICVDIEQSYYYTVVKEKIHEIEQGYITSMQLN